MPRITGLNNKDGRIIVIDESDWSVEANEVVSASPDTGFEITELSAGQKLVVFRKEDGEIEAYGNVTAAADPATSQWYTVFNNSYWTASGPGVTWTGSQWEQSFGTALALIDAGTWSSGYRPTKMRMSYGAPTASVELQDSDGNIIATATNPSSGDEIDITFQGFDIHYLVVIGSVLSSVVTNIEFYSATDPT